MNLIVYGIAFFSIVASYILATLLLACAKIKLRFGHPGTLAVNIFLMHFFYFFFLALQSYQIGLQVAYFLFALALSITAHTDVQTLLISRYVTLFLVPFAWLAAHMGFLLISPLGSIIGALLGLITLGITARLAYRWTGQESLGQGDIDLLIFVGAFLGPIGCWKTLLIGSIAGSLFGIALLFIYGQTARNFKLPFGTFLACGALFTVAQLFNFCGLFNFMTI